MSTVIFTSHINFFLLQKKEDKTSIEAPSDESHC